MENRNFLKQSLFLNKLKQIQLWDVLKTTFSTPHRWNVDVNWRTSNKQLNLSTQMPLSKHSLSRDGAYCKTFSYSTWSPRRQCSLLWKSQLRQRLRQRRNHWSRAETRRSSRDQPSTSVRQACWWEHRQLLVSAPPSRQKGARSGTREWDSHVILSRTFAAGLSCLWPFPIAAVRFARGFPDFRSERCRNGRKPQSPACLVPRSHRALRPRSARGRQRTLKADLSKICHSLRFSFLATTSTSPPESLR